MSTAQQKVTELAPLRDDTLTPRTEFVDHVIKSRFACRSFSDRVVPQHIVEELLEVARFAPSGANIQPWRVYVVAGDKKDEMSAILLKAHEEARNEHASEYQYYASSLPEPYVSRRNEFGQLYYGALGIQQSDMAARARQTAKNYSFFGATAGLIITIDRRLEVGSWLDLGMFLQNILIAAGARGLQTCPQETFAKYHKLLRQVLPITPDETVVCGISLGYGEDSVVSTGSLMPKTAVTDFAYFEGFARSTDD
jgi:nitroreductase